LFREEKRVKKRKKVVKSKLSFATEDDEGGKDEDVDGMFISLRTGPSTDLLVFGSLLNQTLGMDNYQMTIEPPAKRPKKVAKNPTVDTSFLPDRDREQQEREIRETLRQEWLKKQEELKDEDVEIVYSYWDGSGHRKSVGVRFAYDSKSFTDMINRSRKATRSPPFSKKPVNNSPNSEASTSIISCTSRKT
jgi:protein FAM50